MANNFYIGPDGQRYYYHAMPAETGVMPTSEPADIRRIFSMESSFPELAYARQEEEFFDPYTGEYKRAGDYKYSDADLQRIYDMQGADTNAQGDIFRRIAAEGVDPLVAESYARMAEFMPIVGTEIAVERGKDAVRKATDAYRQGDNKMAAMGVLDAVLSGVDVVGTMAPFYGPAKRGATGLIDMAIGAVRRKR